MFRRAVFALMLIGAAFAGGAAINGPGLAWLQRNFAGPSIIVDVDDPTRPAGNPPPRQFPTAKTPPLMSGLAPAATAKKKAEPRPSTELALADEPLLPESPSTPASALAPLPKPETALTEEDPPVPPLPSDPSPTPAPMPPEPSALPRLDTPPKTDPVARLASVERPAASASTTPTSWGDLRKKMKDLGITRYTIEGETDGRVRFRCVIPVDGLKAISHHFEAEGDDEQQAAEAALKRIALWKATSAPE
jgi:hypothetical protein